MQHPPLTFGARVRATLIGAGSLLLIGTTLAGTALAADQPATNSTVTTQATSAQQTPEALGPHTHQLHGIVKTAPSSGATSFTLTTDRFGDVTVAFAGTTLRGHGHAVGHARSFELAKVSALKSGERVVVQGRTSPDGKSFVARHVHVLPARDAAGHPKHQVGTISGVASTNGATILTLKLADGTSMSMTVSSDTKIRPEGKAVADLTVGTKVTVVSKNGAATGIVILPA